VAWKVIERKGTTHWRPIVERGDFRCGIWNRAKEDTPGFNCFTTKKAAVWFKNWFGDHVVVKIRVRNIRGYGSLNNGYAVIVAREIFVPKLRKQRR
jgi:hypothetical protein